MKEWIMEHPWLTFILLAMVIYSIDNAHVNWAKVRLAKIQGKQENTTISKRGVE